MALTHTPKKEKKEKEFRLCFDAEFHKKRQRTEGKK